jgi:hypothetical protein
MTNDPEDVSDITEATVLPSINQRDFQTGIF